MILPCARPKVPSVYGFHVNHIVLTCSGYWKYIHVFFLDDISQKLLCTRFIWSMLCDALEFAVEAVVLDVTVMYSLEAWKPYYASSLGVSNMQFCMKWIHNDERLCLKTIRVLYQQMARYCKEQRFKVFRMGISSREGVKVLCYKSEGRWFDPSWCHWNFSLI